MKVAYYNMTREEVEQFLRLAMLATLRELVAQKIITEEQAEKINATRTPMLLMRESLLEKIADWLFGKGKDPTHVVMAPLPEPAKEEAK